MRNAEKWDIRFLELAEHIARWSKDPSTQVGAVIVRSDRTVASLGYNGFPRGMADSPKLYADRDAKYPRVIHAEMNALLVCSDPKPLTGCTLYTTAPTCSRCAAHLAQSGIRRFVFRTLNPEVSAATRERWGVGLAQEILKGLGCSFTEINAENQILMDYRG